MRRLLSLCFAAFVLVAAACGDDDDAAVPSSGEQRSTTTETTEAETTTTSSEDDSTTTTTEADGDGASTPELGQTCTSPDGFTISYPEDWDAVSDCGQFGPAPLEEPTPNTDERSGVVTAYIDPVPFAEVSDPLDQEEEDRATTTVEGLQAVRIEATLTGEGLYPEGTQAVSWYVDLTVDQGGSPASLILAAYDIGYEDDFDEAVEIMDAMARSLEIDAAPEQVDDDVVVARYEGGGAPFTVGVAASASTPASCFRLMDAEANDCVERVETDDGVAITTLEGPAEPITVGVAGPEVFAVELRSDGDTFRFLPVPYPGRDSRAFAVPVALDDLTEVVLEAHDGTVLDEVDPADAERPAD